MRRTARILHVILLSGVLAMLSGCGAASTGPKAEAIPLPALGPGQQRVVLEGLVVTLTMPAAPESPEGRAALSSGKGRAQIDVRAENATETTMAARVFRNVPRLYDSNGAEVTDAQSGWYVGRGVLAGPAATGDAPALQRDYTGPEGLAPNGLLNGLVVTKYSTVGRGYVLRWDFGSGRVAEFDLP